MRSAVCPFLVKLVPVVFDFAFCGKAPSCALSSRRNFFAPQEPLVGNSDSPAFSLKGKVKI